MSYAGLRAIRIIMSGRISQKLRLEHGRHLYWRRNDVPAAQYSKVLASAKSGGREEMAARSAFPRPSKCNHVQVDAIHGVKSYCLEEERAIQPEVLPSRLYSR